ncbi:MAG: HNH endonuclease [Saprospiraceae bacterium]|nr:HNH endonuclease [Saprospiraceae bacterium]
MIVWRQGQYRDNSLPPCRGCPTFGAEIDALTVLYKIKLNNSDDLVLVDGHVYEHLATDPFLSEIGLLDGLRKHSGGGVVFQKLWRQPGGKATTRTIYLHRYIAERFLTHVDVPGEKEVVRCKNGNKLDCRLENLFWSTRAESARLRKTRNRSGFKGVYREYNKYRAVISVDQKNIHLGMFETPVEASKAYRKKASELLGLIGKQQTEQVSVKPQASEFKE